MSHERARTATGEPGHSARLKGRRVLRVRRHGASSLRAFAVPLIAATALTGHGTGAVSAPACVAPTAQPSSPGTENLLSGVDVLSRHRAWAVGQYSNSAPSGSTLIEQWNGTAWQQVPSPNPASGFNENELSGVAAASRTDAWAVGSYSDIPNRTLSLIEHWDGTSWSQVPSPSPGTGDFLNAVADLSPASAWAVGDSFASSVDHSLIAHWDGTSWQQVPSPDPGSAVNVLNGVAATSPTDAWAVGDESNNGLGNQQSLILHWDGTSWAQVPSPDPGGSFENVLEAVSAVSATDAWAVGVYNDGSTADQTLILHWDGTTWSQVPSPDPGSSGNLLRGVAAVSATSAWAVGSDTSGSVTQTLVAHWNGTRWKQVPSPNPNSSAFLLAVGAASATSMWAVGDSFNGTSDLTMAAHCR